MRCLIIAEHDGQNLNTATARAVAAASQLGVEAIDVAVLAHGGQALAEQAAILEGVSQVLLLDREENAHPLAAVLAPQIAALAEGYSHLFMPSTTFGKDVLPRVAALMGLPQISDLMTVKGPHHFERPVYAGNAIIELQCPPEQPVLATVRTASFKPVGTGDAAPIETRALEIDLPGHTRFVALEADAGDRPDLQSAERVVSGGRGLGSEENFRLVEQLADKLHAAVGASRAAVDAGYAPNDLQVGQTGKIIAPELYIALGISGAIQHLTGIKDAGTIVAINKDPDAPIFEVADLGLVGDLFEIVPQLLEKLD